MKTPLFAVCFSLLACSDDPPILYVPGEQFRETVQISTGGGASPIIGVDEPLTLHARRTAGPWIAIPRAELGDRRCPWNVAPPEVEAEVADNVRWLVQPDSASAVFNLKISKDHTRNVRFSKPGIYRLTAHSNVSCTVPAAVDTLVVKVIERS
jgi:hypothetical protein